MKLHRPLDEFTKLVLFCFCPTDYKDPSEALTRLKQTLKLADYKKLLKSCPIRLMALVVLLQDPETTSG